MQKNLNQLYEEIQDLKTKKEFLLEISRIKQDSDNLLDDDTVALLIVDELGRNKQNICKISELKPEMECTVFGKITNINPYKNFNRKNGSTGRVINLELSDESGRCGLALWDKDVDLVSKKIIQIGTKVKVINGYIKNGFNGIEINVGRWGLIETESEEQIKPKIEKPEHKFIIKGKLTEVEPTKAFFKDNGEFGFVTKIKIETKEEIKQITIWNQKVKEIQKIKKGEYLKIEYIDIKQNNGKKELHLNSKGVITKIQQPP
jgi:replication factor A1